MKSDALRSHGYETPEAHPGSPAAGASGAVRERPEPLTLATVVERFSERFSRSGELSEEGRSYIPGGYSRNSLTFGPHAIYVDHGQGQYLHTVDGHRLLDCHNNFSASILGHDHPHVREAMLDLLPRGFSFGNPMQHEHTLARMLCERIASVQQVAFTCSASEACIAAVRYARSYTGKSAVAKLEGGYHGLGDEFLFSVHPLPGLFPGAPTHPAAVPETGGLSAGARDNVVVLPQNDLASSERILTQNAHRLSCVIVELQSGAGGVITLDADYARGLQDLARTLGILLVVDETITLRASYHGLQSAYGIEPDLTVMGKIIGGGLPLGAVGGRADLLGLNEDGQVYHSGTHHGHPLSTIAGIATLEVLDERTYERLNRHAERIRTELNTWAGENGYAFFVYGVGSHLGYGFPDEPGRRYRSCRDILRYTNEERLQIFAFELANRGVFPMHRGQIALSEPMTDADIDLVIETAKDVVAAIFA